MGMIDDLATALNEYPGEHVVITITDFKEPGTHINVDEICSFNARVENNGHLDMKNVKLHVEATRFTSVSVTTAGFLGVGVPVSFGNSVVSGGRDVNAHSTVTYGDFHMRAVGATPDGGTARRDLFTVHISTFDAGLENILKDHSHHAGNPEVAYARHIHPE